MTVANGTVYGPAERGAELLPLDVSADGLDNSINTITFASAAQLDFCGIQKIVDAVGLHAGLPQRDDAGKITNPSRRSP